MDLLLWLKKYYNIRILVTFLMITRYAIFGIAFKRDHINNTILNSKHKANRINSFTGVSNNNINPKAVGLSTLIFLIPTNIPKDTRNFKNTNDNCSIYHQNCDFKCPLSPNIKSLYPQNNTPEEHFKEIISWGDAIQDLLAGSITSAMQRNPNIIKTFLQTLCNNKRRNDLVCNLY